MANFEKINYALENLDMLQFDGNDETRITEAYEKHLKSRPTEVPAVTTEIKEFNPTVTTVTTDALEDQLVAPADTAVVNPLNLLTTSAIEQNKKVDLILEDNADLINPEWKGWHAKKIKQHGAEYYLQCCAIARKEGKDPSRCLTWLLNKSR